MPRSLTDRFQAVKDKVEKLKEDRDKAQGAQDQILERLRNEFGCSTLKQGQKKLDELDKNIDEKEKQFKNDLDQFEEDWKEHLS